MNGTTVRRGLALWAAAAALFGMAWTTPVRAHDGADERALRAAIEHAERHAPPGRKGGKGFRIVAAGRPLQAVEQHQQRAWPGVRAGRRGRIGEIDVDEIPVGGVPALAAVHRRRPVEAARIQRRPDGLQVAAGQPARRHVAHR